MNEFRNRIRPDWSSALNALLDRARATKSAVFAFDLDSTLFDNRARQARILREFGLSQNIPSLARCEEKHWDSGWDMKAAMRSCGMSTSDVDKLYPAAKSFWQARFFTSEYCKDDTEIAGAAKFVHACLATSATVTYLTGRHEGMREGTIECLRRWGFPVPGAHVQLIMKPTLAEDDDSFKRDAHEGLKKLGTLVAAFDNEPTHANDYRRKFPEATVIHLATDHSGRPVELLEGIVSVPHFDTARA
ncbi:MAG: hypothetical protein ACJ790_14385 [Myxococcaceae bacterium]